MTATIDNSIFQACPKLKSVTISGYTTIGTGLFTNCTSLTVVNFDFDNIYGITASTGMPTSKKVTTTSIGNKAFDSCTALEKVIAPKQSMALQFAENNNLEQEVISNDIYASEFFIYGIESLGSSLTDEELKQYGDYVTKDDSGTYQLKVVNGYKGGFTRLTFKYAETPFIGKSFISQSTNTKTSMQTVNKACFHSRKRVLFESVSSFV